MEVSAQLNNLRISPRKVRLVCELVRGMKVGEARVQLEFSNKKSSKHLLKLLDSAIANAKNNFKLNEEGLYINEMFVNSGPTLKRWRPRAMGRAFEIKKRTCNVTIILGEHGDNSEDLKEKKQKEEMSLENKENTSTVDDMKKKVISSKQKKKDVKETGNDENEKSSKEEKNKQPKNSK